MRTRIIREWAGIDTDKREFIEDGEVKLFYTVEKLNGTIGIHTPEAVVVVRRKDFEKFSEARIKEFLREHITTIDVDYLFKWIKKDLGIGG